jgi:hypothetical protein
MGEYQDRFEAARYSADEGISLTLEDVHASQGTFTMPERLFNRAQQIAAAYELHLLPSIDYHDTLRLSKDQMLTLQDELTFIRSLVTDPLLDTYIQGALELILTGVRAARHVELIVQGP